MKTKETKKTKHKKGETKSTDKGCYPGNFQEMFQKMNKCFTREGGFPDCSVMMEAMKRQSCCGPITAKVTKGSGKGT